MCYPCLGESSHSKIWEQLIASKFKLLRNVRVHHMLSSEYPNFSSGLFHCVLCHFTCLWRHHAYFFPLCDICFLALALPLTSDEVAEYSYSCVCLRFVSHQNICLLWLVLSANFWKALLMAKKWKSPDLNMKLEIIHIMFYLLYTAFIDGILIIHTKCCYFSQHVLIKYWSPSGEHLQRK